MAFVKQKAVRFDGEDRRERSRDCVDLASELEDANPTSRRWAARDLIDCPNAARALVSRLKREEEVPVREVILTTLIRLDDASALGGLVECLRSEDAALRNEVIEAMKLLPGEVAPIMQSLLADLDPDVRIFAVNILESLRHADVESWLIQVIEKDPEVNVCAAAVDLLSEVASAKALQPLVRLKSRFSEEPYIQFAAELALQRIRGV
jgi:HEAT repeat protein